MGTRSHLLARRLLDLAVYAVGMTMVVAVALLPASAAAGAGLNGVKLGLFFAGVLAFGYATVLLWPSRPGEERIQRPDGDQPAPDASDQGLARTGNPDGGDRREETRFESVVGRVPLPERFAIPPVERFHPGTKLYVASLLMLGTSYVMETVFGVQA